MKIRVIIHSKKRFILISINISNESTLLFLQNTSSPKYAIYVSETQDELWRRMCCIVNSFVRESAHVEQQVNVSSTSTCHKVSGSLYRKQKLWCITISRRHSRHPLANMIHRRRRGIMPISSRHDELRATMRGLS